MQIDAGDLVKIIAAIGSACAGLGGGFAFAKPFAVRFFESYLKRAEQREADERERANAVLRIAASHERMVGVLEAVDRSITRSDARLDRIEAHLGISPSPSAIPSPLPPVEARRHLTNPDIAVPQLAPLSAGSGPRSG
jgi:hypothetical protein